MITKTSTEDVPLLVYIVAMPVAVTLTGVLLAFQGTLVAFGWGLLAAALNLPKISIIQAIMGIILTRMIVGYKSNKEEGPMAFVVYYLISFGLLYFFSLFL